MEMPFGHKFFIKYTQCIAVMSIEISMVYSNVSGRPLQAIPEWCFLLFCIGVVFSTSVWV